MKKMKMSGKMSGSTMGMNNCLLLYVVLLFAWVPVFGVLIGMAESDVTIMQGLWLEISYLFTDPQGFRTLAIFLSPLLASQLNGRAMNVIYVLPLIWLVYDTSLAVKDYSQYISYWVMTIVAFYAAVKIASLAK